jgi:ParE toxin of type II toxin-antitoxin system, parDE
MRVVLEHEAEAEMIDAAQYYEMEQQGLGGVFLDEVEVACADAWRHPRRYAYYERPIRSIALKRFPYRLLFAVQEDRVLVVAVMHLHQRPGYWKHRLE